MAMLKVALLSLGGILLVCSSPAFPAGLPADYYIYPDPLEAQAFVQKCKGSLGDLLVVWQNVSDKEVRIVSTDITPNNMEMTYQILGDYEVFLRDRRLNFEMVEAELVKDTPVPPKEEIVVLQPRQVFGRVVQFKIDERLRKVLASEDPPLVFVSTSVRVQEGDTGKRKQYSRECLAETRTIVVR